MAAALVAAALLIALSRLGGRPGPLAPGPPPAFPTQATALGQRGAPVLIEEFSDFQCHYCALFHQETFPALTREFITPGLVYFLYRHYPFLGQESLRAAQASGCAAEQGRFWDYVTLLFARQAGVERGAFSSQKLEDFARQLGLELSQFHSCLEGGRLREAVIQDFSRGQALGVRATPTFYINGRKVEGAQPIGAFRSFVREELERKPR